VRNLAGRRQTAQRVRPLRRDRPQCQKACAPLHLAREDPLHRGLDTLPERFAQRRVECLDLALCGRAGHFQPQSDDVG